MRILFGILFFIMIIVDAILLFVAPCRTEKDIDKLSQYMLGFFYGTIIMFFFFVLFSA